MSASDSTITSITGRGLVVISPRGTLQRQIQDVCSYYADGILSGREYLLMLQEVLTRATALPEGDERVERLAADLVLMLRPMEWKVKT